MPKLSIVTVTRSRPRLLARAIDSLKSQSSQDFEWIVINDGEDIATKKIIICDAEIKFPFIYLDMPHPERGFALAYGRNRGLTVATRDIVTYLNDDNTFKPDFVAETLDLFENHPQVNYAMPIQQQWSEILRDSAVIDRSQELFPPTLDYTIEQLIRHEQFININGFAHRNTGDLSLMWNPNLQVYIDYEFFLKCVDRWGRQSFAVNPAISIDYLKISSGIIDSFDYQRRARELDWIVAHKHLYPCLDKVDILALYKLAGKYLLCYQENKNSDN